MISMTLQELYASIGGSYAQATRVLRVDRLVDKHIRRFVANGVIDQLLEACKTLEPKQMFEVAHAAKGVCGNLGLVELADISSELAEEFRPGNARRLTDDQVRQKADRLAEVYRKTVEGINAYAGA